MKLWRDSIALTSCGIDGLVVADDAGEERLAGLQLADEVVADFLLDRPRAIARLPRDRRESECGRHGSILYRCVAADRLVGAVTHSIDSRRATSLLRGAAAARLRASRRQRAGAENTIAAFDNGLALGADGLELDVHLSRDGVVVVHHDRLLERTTDAARSDRASATADELRARRRPDARRGPARAIAIARIIVEMKVNTPELAAATVDVVRRADAVDRVCLGSFGLRVLRAARAHRAGDRDERRARGSALGAVSVVVPLAGVARRATAAIRCRSWSGRTRVVSPRFVDDAHDAGLGVQVWTVDTTEAARRLLGWGVDALITDRPDVIVPLVKVL